LTVAATGAVAAEIAGIIKKRSFADSDIFHDFERDDAETSGRRVYDIWNFPKADNDVLLVDNPSDAPDFERVGNP